MRAAAEVFAKSERPVALLRIDDSARFVEVIVDDNGEGRPGVVHVLESPALGFPWAAAVCATFQQFEPGTAAQGSARFGKPLNIRSCADPAARK